MDSGGWGGRLGNADAENAVREADHGHGFAEIERQAYAFAKPSSAGCLDVQLGALDADDELVRTRDAWGERDEDLGGLVEHVDQLPFRDVDLRLRHRRLTSDRKRLVRRLRGEAVPDGEADAAGDASTRRSDRDVS